MTVPWFSTDQVLPAAPKIALPLLTSTAPSDAIVSGEAYLPLVPRTTSDWTVCPLIIDTVSPRRLVCCPIPLGRQAGRGAATVLQHRGRATKGRQDAAKSLVESARDCRRRVSALYS